VEQRQADPATSRGEDRGGRGGRGKESSASQRRFEIEGRSLGYPALFQDASSAVGLFAVPSKAAQALIRESGFEVAEIWPGRAIFSLSCVNYRESDCGAYNEIAMGFFVKKQAGSQGGVPYLGTWLDILRDRAATYVWKLPVTTRLANDAGILMCELTGERATFALHMGGREVLRYSVRARGKGRRPRSASAVYSVFEGAPHVTQLAHEDRDAGFQLGGGRLQLGDHPLAQELRGLGLPHRPLVASWIGRIHLDVGAPEKL